MWMAWCRAICLYSTVQAASENVWESAIPRPSLQMYNKATGCVLGKEAASSSPLSHGLGPSPGVFQR